MQVQRVTWILLGCSVGVFSQVPYAFGAPSSEGFAPLRPGSSQPILQSRWAPQMRQSYTLSYASTGHASQSAGLYLNQMTWQLGAPLTLHLDLGMYSPLQGSGTGNVSGIKNSALFIPRVGLEWRPTENLQFQLNYAQVPVQNMFPYSPYSPWSP